jgi:hypothetical protein
MICSYEQEPGEAHAKGRFVFRCNRCTNAVRCDDASQIRGGKCKASRCVHLRQATGEFVSCNSCKGSVRIKVYSCAVLGVCLPMGRKDKTTIPPVSESHDARVNPRRRRAGGDSSLNYSAKLSSFQAVRPHAGRRLLTCSSSSGGMNDGSQDFPGFDRSRHIGYQRNNFSFGRRLFSPITLNRRRT